MDKPVVRTSRRRREHSAEFKRQLVARSLEPGASVAAVAMEGGINANLLFGWRRKYLDGLPQIDSATPQQPSAVLLPVSIEAAPADRRSTPSSLMRPAGGAIEIEIGNARVRLRGSVDEANLRTVLTALRSLT
ncbi:MAG: transposase [Chitinophagaceae bacterium]|nr:transposase [Rubrivivax sp.]